jgi:uncharacterized membrane protein YuzA (DUF378 family)
MPLLKKLFWLYFLLLIFEGALRKWVLPGLSAPLLLVRDPVAIFIIIEAYRTNKWPERWSVVTGVLTCALLGLCIWQMILGDNPWIAAVYGLRSYLLPFPVAFIMGENLDADDLRKFGAATLWLMLPLVALEVAQYLAPEGSILNAGAYKGAEQIYYAEEHVRASGTFSFVIGPTFYNAIVAALLFYGLMNRKFAKKWLLWAAAFALVLSVPVIGSRTLVAELAGVAVCGGIAALFGVSQFVKVVKIVIPLLAVYFLVSLLPVFSSAAESLHARSTNAYSTEGGMRRAMVERTSGSIIAALINTDYSNHLIGIGMGRGAAAVSALSTGRVQFVAGEYEFVRELVELGSIPGIAFSLFRFLLALSLTISAFKCARRQEPLALLLVTPLFATLCFGLLEQPTDQGFMVICVAFTVAAIRSSGVGIEGKIARRAAPPGPGRRIQARPGWGSVGLR